jgi:hypothetical protein
MVDNSELDSFLDKALARYSQAEPLAGLEERVLQRVRRGQLRRKIAGGLAMCCLAAAATVGFIVLMPVRVERPSPVEMKLRLPDMRWQTAKSDTPPHLQRRARGRVLPKQPDFPARTPLSPEERVLLRGAGSSINLAKNDEPITIEPIEVSPITINDSGAKNEPSKP